MAESIGNCNCIMLIFGAAGDLTKRKLLPALFQLEKNDLLHKEFKIIGISRREKTDVQYREEAQYHMQRYISDSEFSRNIWDRLSKRLYYRSISIKDPDSMQQLIGELQSLKPSDSRLNIIIYFALPPSTIALGLEVMQAINFTDQLGGEAKALVEKPFGRDTASAEALNRLLSSQFNESQIYRIDHYLAKDTVRNLMVFRFGNAIFEPLWNRNYIDNIQITATETIGVEGRGGFYEDSGIVRDMLQNHVMQILSLIAMESPLAGNEESIRNKKMEVFQSILPIMKEDFVFGQYDGYRDETDVDPKSMTPTFVALRMYLDNWRWQGVPFYIRTGKSVAKKVSEVIVQFRQVPFCVFGSEEACQQVKPNILAIRIQPDEGIRLSFSVRMPGSQEQLTQSHLDFRYDELGKPVSGGYEQVIYDGMRGKPSLFWRADSIEASWRVVTPMLDVPKNYTFPNYKPGSWGPEAAMNLLKQDHRQWLTSY